jgi:hypothetical protein
MKKLIQICPVLCLVLAFSFISANARTTTKLKADIPFDFNAGGNHYKAGRYTLKISNSRTGAVIHITDAENKVLDTMLASVSSNTSDGESVLVFNNYEGQRFLTGIATRDDSIKISRSTTGRQAASGKWRAEKKPEIIAIAITNL